LIGPSDIPREVTLPGGRKVKVISVATEGDSRGKVKKYEQSAWAPDDSLLYLLDVANQTLGVWDLSTGHKSSISTRLPDEWEAQRIKVTSNRVFFSAQKRDSPGVRARVYALDSRDLNASPKLIAKDSSNYFQVNERTETLLLQRVFGVKSLPPLENDVAQATVAPDANIAVSVHYPDEHEEPVFKVPYGPPYFTYLGGVVFLPRTFVILAPALYVTEQGDAKEIVLLRRKNNARPQ
jgi:hypothetical protein